MTRLVKMHAMLAWGLVCDSQQLQMSAGHGRAAHICNPSIGDMGTRWSLEGF